MAKVSNTLTRIYVDKYDFSGILNSFTIGKTQETPEVACFGDGGPRRLVGNYDASVSLMGFFEPTTLINDAVQFGLLDDTDHLVCVCPGAFAAGSVAYEDVIAMTSRPMSAATGGAVMANVEGAGRNASYRGTVLFNAISTGAQVTSGINFGASTTPTVLVATFRLLAFTGTSVTMTIEESSDDGAVDTYALISGMTSGVLSAANAVRVTTSATTEAWKRLRLAGTYTSATVMVTFGTQS